MDFQEGLRRTVAWYQEVGRMNTVVDQALPFPPFGGARIGGALRFGGPGRLLPDPAGHDGLLWLCALTGHVDPAPYLLLATATALGIGLWGATIAVRFRDLQFAISYACRFGCTLRRWPTRQPDTGALAVALSAQPDALSDRRFPLVTVGQRSDASASDAGACGLCSALAYIRCPCLPAHRAYHCGLVVAMTDLAIHVEKLSKRYPSTGLLSTPSFDKLRTSLRTGIGRKSG